MDLTATDRRGAVGDIQDALREVSRARDCLTQAVLTGRQAGLTWQDIGAVLGTSRQAAWERFELPRRRLREDASST